MIAENSQIISTSHLSSIGTDIVSLNIPNEPAYLGMSLVNGKVQYYTSPSDSLSNFFSLPTSRLMMQYNEEIINYLEKNFNDQKVDVKCSMNNNQSVLECKKINLDKN